jgi:SRSO17 transposase
MNTWTTSKVVQDFVRIPGGSVLRGHKQPEPSAGKSGRPRSLLRRAPGHEPIGVKDLALTLDASHYRTVIWREGTCTALSSRFAAVRARASHRDYWRSTLRDEEWLLIE